jgi:hypothetical protein
VLHPRSDGATSPGIVLSKGAETGIVEEAIVRDEGGQERHGYRRVIAAL